MARNLTTGEYMGEDGWIHSRIEDRSVPLEIRSQEAPAFLVFIGPNGEVGRLDWEAGQLTFSGDMAESARIFFKNYLGPYVEAAIKERPWTHRPS